MCALYYNDLNVPIEHDELYSRAIEGLLGAWDAFRSIARDTIFQHMPVRKRISLVCFFAHELFNDGKVVFNYDEVRNSLDIVDACKRLKIDTIDEDDLVNTLYNDFSLIVERAPNLFSFSHLW